MLENLLERFEAYGEKTAIVCGDEAISYLQLKKYAECFGSYLHSRGKNPVIIYADKSINYLISMISCVVSGRTYIPIGKNVPYDRLLHIANVTKAGDIISDVEIPIKTICIENIRLSNSLVFPVLKDNTAPVYTIFTSGTTGYPKGVPISRENVENFLSWLRRSKVFSDGKNEVFLNCAEFCFDLSVADVYYSLCYGKTLVVLQKGEAPSDIISKNAVDTAVMTPTFLKGCLIDKRFNTEYCNSLSHIFLCGEILDKQTVLRMWISFPECNIINAYGPTEATCAVSATLITTEMIGKENSLPVGCVSGSAVDISIDDGEIVLEGKSVFDGYLGTNETVEKYRTGDRGEIVGDLLYFKGRTDSQIKYKGYRIELSDIEANILSLEGVDNCAVITKEKDGSVIALWAYVASRTKKGSDLKEELKSKLPQYMIPKKIIVSEELPTNENGKLDRKALKEGLI